MSARTIRVRDLARVEGEGGLLLRIKNGEVNDVQLRIFEPPRFFEAFLRGRSRMEAPDITARICGICPVAYQMSSCHAIEAASGVRVSPGIRALRRLLYCGEWIESHVLHIYLLHAPDFLGYPDAIAMARDHGKDVKDALRMKKIGNTLMTVIGGREIHPVNVRVGGFYRAPTRGELRALVPELEWGRETARNAVAWSAKLPFPDFTRDYEFVALRHPDEYPIIEGRLVSSKGLDIEIRDYEKHFVEEHVEHSHALHSRIGDRGQYFCGPLARFNLNFDRLTPAAQAAAREAGLPVPCLNPFQGIAVRAVETLYAFEEALRLIEEYDPPEPSFVEVPAREATGWGVTEAPRGILYHRYRLDEIGLIQEAKIVPPTSQNLKTIEGDLVRLGTRLAAMTLPKATALAEQAVRNYDPCISCATHFLRLTIERT